VIVATQGSVVASCGRVVRLKRRGRRGGRDGPPIKCEESLNRIERFTFGPQFDLLAHERPPYEGRTAHEV
jgi:hypothetical protein